MRKMFQDARLVHADLSEFNMLYVVTASSTYVPLQIKTLGCCNLPLLSACRYHGGDAYIIDVSQSVEHDHPHALEFLRKDCSNVNGQIVSIHFHYLLFPALKVTWVGWNLDRLSQGDGRVTRWTSRLFIKWAHRDKL